MNYSLPLDRITGNNRILFPESGDIRVLVAAITLKTMGIVEPVLIGNYSAMLATISDIKKREQYTLGDISDEDINTLEKIETIPLDENPRDQLVKTYTDRK